MKEKIDSPEGRATYSKRLKIVKPVFGNIRVNKGLDRFTLRGVVKVNIEAPCSNLQGVFDLTRILSILIRSLPLQQAAGLKLSVSVQWMLYCLVHNIEKILHFGRSFAMAG